MSSLSIAELGFFGVLAAPPFPCAAEREPQARIIPPEPPMSPDEWRAAAERRRARKFERGLRRRDADAGWQLPLNIACGPMEGSMGLALPSGVAPQLSRLTTRVRTGVWVQTSPVATDGLGGEGRRVAEEQNEKAKAENGEVKRTTLTPLDEDDLARRSAEIRLGDAGATG